MRAGYEKVWTIPEVILLKELDGHEFIFPWSYYIMPCITKITPDEEMADNTLYGKVNEEREEHRFGGHHNWGRLRLKNNFEKNFHSCTQNSFLSFSYANRIEKYYNTKELFED